MAFVSRVQSEDEAEAMMQEQAMPRRKKAAKVSLPPLPQGMMPTAHTMQRYDFEVRQVERNGAKVAVNTNGSPLAALQRSKAITKRQREAGEHFEAARTIVFGGGGTNPIASMMKLGMRVQGGSTEQALAVKQWAERKVDEVRHKCSDREYSVLVDVACTGVYLGRRPNEFGYLALWGALDVCVDVFGVPEMKEDEAEKK